jgi:hypothetical protein
MGTGIAPGTLGKIALPLVLWTFTPAAYNSSERRPGYTRIKEKSQSAPVF